MTELWLGFAADAGRRDVRAALRHMAPEARVVFVQSPWELRERFLDEEPRQVGAIVGDTGEDVSAVNLAAALVRDGRAREVVLVARGASGSLRSRASRAGVTRVVDPANVALAPGHDGSLPRQVPPALVLPSEPSAPHVVETHSSSQVAPVLVIASGRGGVGKSSLVAMLATVAGEWGMEVAAVDLDLSCGNLHTCFGIVRIPDLAQIVRDGATNPQDMGRVGARCSERVRLWGPCERPEMAEVVMPHVAELLSYLSTRFDLVVVDTSTTFTDAVAQAAQACDRLFVVHDGRVGAVASAARMSALAVRLGVARTRIVRVEDLADPRVRRSPFEGRAEVGLETARLCRVVDGGAEAEELLLSGKVSELVSCGGELVDDVSSLLAQTLSELGRLPDSDAARKAAQGPTRRRGLQLFGKRREVL